MTLYDFVGGCRFSLRLILSTSIDYTECLDLGISEKTVEKHLEGVYTKLGAASRVEAAVRAVRDGLV